MTVKYAQDHVLNLAIYIVAQTIVDTDFLFKNPERMLSTSKDQHYFVVNKDDLEFLSSKKTIYGKRSSILGYSLPAS